ncbi:MAG: hypothetical protein D3909_05795 [Candidatus Electrothrix sp. ATG1]|nr:hypothetical protein [Candidatus Electrothrix sp. ATG1]
MDTPLTNELDKFWRWASMTPVEYADNKKGGEWETDYPFWEDIYSCVEEEIKRIEGGQSRVSIQYILEAMAIDNECENILDMLESSKTASQIVINDYYDYPQPEARWQIAELAKRTAFRGVIDMLKKMLINDDNSYVKRRALLSLDELSHNTAKKCAKSFVETDDERLKKLCISILNR